MPCHLKESIIELHDPFGSPHRRQLEVLPHDRARLAFGPAAPIYDSLLNVCYAAIVLKNSSAAFLGIFVGYFDPYSHLDRRSWDDLRGRGSALESHRLQSEFFNTIQRKRTVIAASYLSRRSDGRIRLYQ